MLITFGLVLFQKKMEQKVRLESSKFCFEKKTEILFSTSRHQAAKKPDKIPDKLNDNGTSKLEMNFSLVYETVKAEWNRLLVQIGVML